MEAAPAPRTLSARALAALTGVVLLLAVVGGWLALSGPPGQAATDPTAEILALPGEDEAVETASGNVVVARAQVLKGLTAKQLGGMTHGIQNLVTRDKAMLEADVILTNTSNRPIPYSPRDFGLRAIAPNGRVRPAKTLVTSSDPGLLQPDASIELRFAFVVPRDGRRLVLAYHDPNDDRPVLIRVGRVGLARSSTVPEHDH
jgi:hypothetical protein